MYRVRVKIQYIYCITNRLALPSWRTNRWSILILAASASFR